MNRNYLILNLIFGILIYTKTLAVNHYSESFVRLDNYFSGLQSQTITFIDMTRTYGNGDFVPGATASSNLPVTYTSDNLAVATIVNNKVHIVGGGIANITAYQGGNATFSPVSLTKKLTVNKADQTITFSGPTNITYTQPDFNPFSTPAGPVECSSSNASIISIVNGKLHVTGVGEVTIVASHDGNDNYNAATSKSVIFKVSKANQTITSGGNITKTFLDQDFNPGASTSSGLPVTYSISNTDIATTSTDGIKIKGAGTTQITISQQGNNNYNPASATITLTVNKATQTIDFPALQDVVFEYPDFEPGAIASSNLRVTYTSSDLTVANIVNNKVHIVTTGEVVITAHQGGNSNYLDANDVSQTLKITKSSQSIDFDLIQSHTWGDADFNPNASVSSGLPITYTSSNHAVAIIVNGKIHITGVGSTTITAAQSGDGNYEAATSVSQLFQVNKANQTIPFYSIPEKAIGETMELPAVSSAGLLIHYSSNNNSVVEVYDSNKLQFTGAGVAQVTATQSGNALYNAASAVTQNVIVKNSSQAILFNTLPDKTYGDEDFTISATSNSGLPVYFVSENENIISISGNTAHIVGAGIANIYAMQDGNENYASATPVNQQLRVLKTTQSINFNSIPVKTVLDDPFIPFASATSGLTVELSSSNWEVAMVINGRIYITGIGTCVITASQGGNNNYSSAEPLIQVLTVTKATQTITFGIIPQKTYGDVDFLPATSASSFLTVRYESDNPQVATIVNNKVHIVGVGKCKISALQAGNDYYFEAEIKTQELTVVKAAQTISFEPLPPVEYGCPNFELTASSSSGLNTTFSSTNPFVAKVVDGVVQVINAGQTYIIALQSGNKNYNSAVPVSQLLVVNKKSQIIVFDSIYALPYGSPDFIPEGVSSSGLPVSYSIDNSIVAKIISGKVHLNGVGKAIITATQDGKNSNYSAAEAVSQVISVVKADLTVTPVSKSRNYLEGNPVFTCIYSGFVNSDDESVIDLNPTVTTSANVNSLPGLYDLIASGAMDNNYNFNYQKGILLVLGTMPLKAATPTGETLLCINPDDQKYYTEGATFAYSYEWNILPAEAGVFTSSGKMITVDFKDNFSGKVAITVRAINNKGTGAFSDTLFVNILPIPQPPIINLRGSYCSSNSFGDTIKLMDAKPMYQYQLFQNGEKYEEIKIGNGEKILWDNLKNGEYSIEEEVCNVVLNERLSIKKVDPSSTKPVLQVKWNDVIVCLNNGDSIESFNWYKNGEWLTEERKQYIWTKKEEGYYYIQTTDLDGCIFTSDSVWIDKLPTGELYPNPNDGNFKVSFSSSQTGKVIIRISNMNSAPIKTLNFIKSEGLFETDINLPDLITGTYFVDILLNGERVFYQKLIRK